MRSTVGTRPVNGANNGSTSASEMMRRSSAWRTVYSKSAGARRMFNVCNTAPMPAAAWYASKCRDPFHMKLPIRSPGRMPNAAKAWASWCARARVSANVWRRTPCAVAVTIAASGATVAPRSMMRDINSGGRCMAMASVPSPARRVILPDAPCRDTPCRDTPISPRRCQSHQPAPVAHAVARGKFFKKSTIVQRVVRCERREGRLLARHLKDGDATASSVTLLKEETP